MSTQTKYLAFKGIDKKEQILFKSFLNLAKNELAFKVIVLNGESNDTNSPDLIIKDDAFIYTDQEAGLESLPTIYIGRESRDQTAHICRPAQWSDFKSALAELNMDAVREQQEVERLLPSEVELAIGEMKSSSIQVQDNDDEGDDDYEYELEKLSVDYHSFTSSDYVKVVDDVEEFRDQGALSTNEPIILVTDDESASQNSVLVIETDAMDAWDFSESEISVNEIAEKVAEKESDTFYEKREVVLNKKVGIEVMLDEEYWLDDNEIIVDHQSILFFKPKRTMVYSSLEPARWAQYLQRGGLSKLPMQDDWRPDASLSAYPMSSFYWVHTLITETQNLPNDWDSSTELMLHKWPAFNLVQMDNILLKLCTMLFVRPETVKSLAQKTGYGRSTIVGLINACDSVGLVSLASDVPDELIVKESHSESMFGRIRDVFR